MSRFNLRTNRLQSAFKTLQKRLSVTVRKINAEAAAQMRIGHYETARGLMEVGRSFSDFTKNAEELSNRWDELAAEATSKLIDLGLPTTNAQKRLTSAKALCIPALQIVMGHGGHAEMSEVLTALASSDSIGWTEGDLMQSGGSLRWHTTLDKAYRRSQRLGWIEKRGDGVWQMTDKGRAAIEARDER